MIQSSEALTRVDNRISLVSARRIATQEDCLVVTEREIPADAMEQTWIFGVGQVTRVSRINPGLANAFLKIVDWLNHLGSERVNDSHLEARHNIHHNVKINGIRF